MERAGVAGAPGAAFSSRVQVFERDQRLAEGSDRSRGSAPSFKGTLLATCRLLSMFAATLVAFAPMNALAQDSVSVRDRARPEYDPLGIRLGGFDLNGHLDLSATHTDNLFATETNPVDDTIFHVTPYASLTSRWSRHALGFFAGADFASHQDFSSEDASTYFAGTNGRVDIGSNSYVFGSAGFAHSVESRTDPDAAVSGSPNEFDTTNMEIGARHNFNRYAIQAAVGHREYDFDNTPSRDSEEDYVTGRIEAVFTPRISGFVEATADDRTYNTNDALSSDGRSYLAGVTLNFSELMRGEIGVGYFNRDYNGGESLDGVALSGNLEWYVTRLTTLTFDANRSGQDRGGIGNAPFVESRYGARVDHELLRNLILSGSVDWGQREYEVIDRQDEFNTVAIEASYLLDRRMSLFARADRIEVDSSGADRYRSFDASSATVGIRLKL